MSTGLRGLHIYYITQHFLFNLIYMRLFKHTWVCMSTVLLRFWTESAFLVHRFRNVLFYYALFITLVSCTCVYRSMYMHVWMCVCPYLSSRHNAVIINIQCCGTSYQAEKDKEHMTGSLLCVRRSLHIEKGVSEEFNMHSFGALMASSAWVQ